MRHYLISLLIGIVVTACSDCNVVEGNYFSSGGGEQSTRLTLLSDKTFVLEHEEWQPGHYEEHSMLKTTGTWTCKSKLIALEAQGKSYNGELITIGENPLGLEDTTQALFFKGGPDNQDSYFQNAIFYPE